MNYARGYVASVNGHYLDMSEGGLSFSYTTSIDHATFFQARAINNYVMSNALKDVPITWTKVERVITQRKV